MISLLDVSVLIALVDADHEKHAIARRWFTTAEDQGWATCPITENGVVRIVGSNGYANSPKSFSAVTDVVRRLRSRPGHVFWADDISLFDSTLVSMDQLTSSGQLTDTYLLALAVFHRGVFVTFDRRVVATAVSGGTGALKILG